MFIHVAASLGTTGVIVWYAVRKGAGGRRGYEDPHVAVAAAVIAANAAIGYAYAKDEILAFGGTFYALAFYAAARSVLSTLPRTRRTALVGTTLGCVLMALWATRVAGLHVVLREQAFFVRNDWVARQEREAMTDALRREALGVPTVSPRSWPLWVAPWLGER
jgi:hypothetical protein